MVAILPHYRPVKALFVVVLSVIVIFALFIFLPDNQSSGNKQFRTERASLRIWPDVDIDSNNQFGSQEAFDLTQRIEDLKRIKLSVRNELRFIEREKQKLLREKSSLVTKNDKLASQIAKSKAQLKQLELDISANRKQKFEKACDENRMIPIVFKPLKPIDIDFEPASSDNGLHYLVDNHIQIVNSDLNPHDQVERYNEFQLDFSHCPLTNDFKFSVNITTLHQDGLLVEPNLIDEVLKSHRQYADNVTQACLIIHIIDSTRVTIIPNSTFRNNLVIDIASNGPSRYDTISNGMIASSKFTHDIPMRYTIDVALPSVWNNPESYENIIGAMPPQSPIDRKYLAAYFGHESSGIHQLSKYEEILRTIHRNSFEDSFSFVYNCETSLDSICHNDRLKVIEASLYLIILPGPYEVDPHINSLLYAALSKGTIPVIFNDRPLRLPFDEVIDWRKACILLSVARLPELHFILKSLAPADLYQMKYHGRRIFENHLATIKQIIETTVTIMSLERFNYPPPNVVDYVTTAHNSNYQLILDTNCQSSTCSEVKSDSTNSIISSEMLGPREKPFASPAFRRNLSLALRSNYDLWNNPMYSPFELYPQHPNDPAAPSEFKFYSLDQGYRPINNGLGGSGVEFSQALGGDYPNEQFTIVILTYQRQTLLMRLLERLKGLAYLNKIIVVWNDIVHKPPEDLIWPDTGVPLVIAKVERNSLNNRFLPYDAIETEALFTMDDDSPLRADEIVLAFRVWRQSRDRIVGFPGRYHAWDNDFGTWMYNSNHSCEISMVLTGGAFFHKYYTYLYTYSMPQAIRSIVDRFMNCEDIAMNFLVAHLTRQPPIKVTSRWTFHCAGCTSSLSEDDSHFKERHECLNTFASIYGYMPLLSTQHRSDSVLFKTRLPQNKQKCFKFV